jgi:uncharacterized Tic20 family protein
MAQRPPSPAGSSGDQSEDNSWALLAYVSPIIVSFIGPLVIYLVKMNESRFVRFHAAQSLNLLITSVLYCLGLGLFSVLLAVTTPGLGPLAYVGLYLVLGFVVLVYLMIAGVAASRGRFYRVPGWLCLRIVY